ncbi:helix-turn-helix transcriptional regulator [Trueperella pecoris]|uniref:helix-turn-helix transcriptional regulator n=1 Tax=Trueperella pecoris TaxID=2733571 RepID=UPI0018D4B470|nr:helix-turn-helix transcriptional regulator [Trueperella pecoris]QTG74654.1 helix-turn-helix transcriptional regulator [Trueperella pecoris]
MTEHSAAERAFASTFGKTLINHRKRLGLTQEQVALEADINRNHYQLLEYGRADRKSNNPANPRLNTLIKLARVFDCSVADLLRQALEDYDTMENLTKAS